MEQKSPPTLLDFLLVFARWKRAILSSFFGVCTVVAIIGFSMTRWYRATCTILPPQKDLSRMGLSALAGSFNLGALGVVGTNEETLTYLAVLQSETMMRLVADNFKLQEIYETDNWERTLKALRNNVDISVNKEGTISVSVLDKDKQRSADMSNAFVFYLDSLNTQFKVQKARGERIFIEKRYNQNKADLASIADSMRLFQQVHGVVALPEQTEAVIKALAELQAQITATEVEMGVKSKYVAPDQEEMLGLKDRLIELKKKLSEFTYGGQSPWSNGNTSSSDGRLFMPLRQVPDIATEYARIYRELQVQSKIYELLTQQYETARIQEARDTPTVQILDPAVPPIRKAKPKVSILVLLAGLTTLLASMTIAVVSEALQRHHAEATPTSEKIKALRLALRWKGQN